MTRWQAVVTAVLLLVCQNGVLFWPHYVHDAGFPFDFSLSYFAVPRYWITCLQHGSLPQWVAQQAMGYPLLMNLQSGLFYPPFWLIVLVGEVYTLHTAVVMQCLHVVAGALGMWWFVTLHGLPWAPALAAGIAYQFFGGFYSNAEHPDIIRGYALLPWFLAGLSITNVRTDSPRRPLLLVPLCTYLLVTGAYPGVAIAALWVGSWLVLFQVSLPNAEADGPSLLQRSRLALERYALMTLGLLMGAAHLLPPWLQRDSVARLATTGELDRSYWHWANFFTLFLSGDSNALLQDISMRSGFVSTVMCGMVFFLRPSTAKKHVPFILLLLLAIFMITGGWLYHVSVVVIPPLGMSRFPSADYRAYVAILLIFLAAAALTEFVRHPPANTAFFARLAVWLLTMVTGWVCLYRGRAGSDASAMFIIVVLLFAALVLLSHRRRLSPPVFYTGCIALIVLDGGGMWLANRTLWLAPEVSFAYLQSYGVSPTRASANTLVDRLGPLRSRPPRLDSVDSPFQSPMFPWRGYLTGEFMLRDYAGGMHLKRQQEVLQSPALVAFMAQSSAHVLTAGLPDVGELEHLLSSPPDDDGRVALMSYSNDEIVYRVTLPEPAWLVENEMYFPGWTASLDTGDGARPRISAEAAGGLLRAWALPRGNYALITRFAMPHLRVATGISLAAVVVWLCCLLAECRQVETRVEDACNDWS